MGVDMAEMVYRRTAGDTVDYVSRREGMGEINAAQMDGRGVRAMSQISRTDFEIVYSEEGAVSLVLVDAPEPREWRGTHTNPHHMHRFGDDDRARCSRRIRATESPDAQGVWGVHKRTRREIEGREHADLYTFCEKCASI